MIGNRLQLHLAAPGGWGTPESPGLSASGGQVEAPRGLGEGRGLSPCRTRNSNPERQPPPKRWGTDPGGQPTAQLLLDPEP